MREHELYDRLDLNKKKLSLRPVSSILNILAFSYYLMLGMIDELQDVTNTFSMTTTIPCIICEDFRTLASITKGDFENAEMQLKYSLSIDPEDHYSYLFKGLLEIEKGLSGEEYFRKAISLAPDGEKEKIKEKLGLQEDRLFDEEVHIPDYLPTEIVEKLRSLVSSEPNSPILKTSLAEAYIKKRDYRSGEWLIQSVISLYPYYPRALYILSRIYEEHKTDLDSSIFYLKKIFLVNPLSKYVSKKEMFLEERDISDAEELTNLFKKEMPMLNFFLKEYSETKETFEKQSKKEEKERKKENIPVSIPEVETKKAKEVEQIEKKEEPAFVQAYQQSVPETNSEALREAYMKLKEKKFLEAIPIFLEFIKEDDKEN